MTIVPAFSPDPWSVQRVEAALASDPSTFAQLLELLDGQYPADALAALQCLAARDGAPRAARALIIDAGTDVITTANCDQVACLPLPHPSDHEWRFTADTADAVLNRVLPASTDNAPTLLVGVPSLVVAAAARANERRWVVLGTDDVIWDTLRLQTASDPRFAHGSSDELASAAVVDPPWYPRTYYKFFNILAERCRLGAKIFVGAPPAGARPNARSDFEEIVAIAQAFGLALIYAEPGALRYRSPAFELAALRRASVNVHLPQWRRGDLLVFEKQQDRRSASRPGKRPVAFELTLGGVRLRLTPAASATGKALAPLAEGEIYPTVSTRAPGQSAANLWTTGNRAFEVDALHALVALAALALVRGVPAKAPIQLDNLIALGQNSPTQSLMTQFQEMAARETAEMERLVGERSWLRSVNDARFLNGSLSDFLGGLRGAAGSETNS